APAHGFPSLLLSKGRKAFPRLLREFLAASVFTEVYRVGAGGSSCSCGCGRSLERRYAERTIGYMPFLSTLRQRHRQPELIDEPGLAPEHLQEALSGLERINRWSGSAGILWPPIRALAQRMNPQPLRTLDIATGAGDIPIHLWHKARRAGLALQLAG